MDSICAEELSRLLLLGTEMVVVDVRDEDFSGGHLPGAIHVPSQEFAEKAAAVALQVAEHSICVIHCMKSSVRGPACYRVLQSELKKLESEGGSSCKLFLLKGGFETWVSKWGSDPERETFIEGYDPQVWGS
jgi:Cdc25 family phosphatase